MSRFVDQHCCRRTLYLESAPPDTNKAHNKNIINHIVTGKLSTAITGGLIYTMQKIFSVNYLAIYGQIFIRTSYFTFMFVISYMNSSGCLMIGKGLAKVSFIISIFTFA